MNELKQLALDTLYGRRIEPRDSKIRTNKAGTELSNQSEDALSVIENVIEKEVVPAEDLDELIGFNYLIGAYIVIGVRENIERVFTFLKNQPECILKQAIKCSSTFFWKTNNGFNFGVEPNQSLIQFLLDIESDFEGELPDMARRARGQLESYQTIQVRYDKKS